MNDRLCIRPATPSEIPLMQALELDAARLYGTIADYDFCIVLPPRSPQEHLRVQDEGVAWVAILAGAPVGFLLALPVDGRAHVVEAAVALSAQGNGVGRRLFGEFHSQAAAMGYLAATLTTYRDVPWNAPFYQRLGYRIIEVDARRPELLAIRAEEAAAGFEREPRVAMEKLLRV